MSTVGGRTAAAPDISDAATRFASSAATASRVAQLDLALEDERVFSLEGDLGDCGGQGFQLAFPDRFIDVGIAEANLVGVAAGLAFRGKLPFVNTFGAFALMRAGEQVRLDVCYHRANVKFAGTFTGIMAGASGPTHHCIEDLSLACALPNMVVVAPADAIAAYEATLAAAAHDGPVYLRLGFGPTTDVYTGGCPFELGKGIVLRQGHDVALIAAGVTVVPNALAAAQYLGGAGVSAMVVDLHTVKPMDRELIVEAARTTGRVVTVEEHSVCGGLGGAVAEIVAEEHPALLHRIALPDGFCHRVGPYEEHVRHFGLDAASIASSVSDWLERS